MGRALASALPVQLGVLTVGSAGQKWLLRTLSSLGASQHDHAHVLNISAAGAPTAAVAAAAAAAAPADPREGAANRLADADVVALLAQPPKHVRHLRTRDGFRRFFTGVSRARMAALLTQAFAGQPPDEAAARREKRLALLADVLAD